MFGQLLLPSLTLILIITGASFYFASNATPLVLLISSTILLMYAFMLHRSQFETDYKTASWMNGLKELGPLVMVGVVLLLAYGAFALNSTTFMVGGSRRGLRK